MFLLVKVLRARQIGTRQNDVAAAAGRRHFRVQRESTIFLLLPLRRTHLSGATFTAASRLMHCLHTLGVLDAQGGRDALSQRVLDCKSFIFGMAWHNTTGTAEQGSQESVYPDASTSEG